MFIPIISHMILISKLIIITLIIQPSFVLCLQSEDEDNVDSVRYNEHIKKQVGETFANINRWTNSKNDTTEEIGNVVNDFNHWFKDNKNDTTEEISNTVNDINQWITEKLVE